MKRISTLRATSLVAAASLLVVAACGYDPAPPGPGAGECSQALAITGAIAESLQAYDEAKLTSKGTWPAPVPDVDGNATIASNLSDETLARLADQSVAAQRDYNDALTRRDGAAVNVAMGEQSGNISQVLTHCGRAVPDSEAQQYRELEKVNKGHDFPMAPG